MRVEVSDIEDKTLANFLIEGNKLFIDKPFSQCVNCEIVLDSNIYKVTCKILNPKKRQEMTQIQKNVFLLPVESKKKGEFFVSMKIKRFFFLHQPDFDSRSFKTTKTF